MELSFVWNGTKALKNGAAIADRISWADATETAVNVNIESLFSDNIITDKTSGTMQVHAVFTSFTEGNTRSDIAADKAAPVLTSAAYHVGRTLESGTAPDTVVFTLSEVSDVQAADATPLLFINASGPYTVRLRSIGGNGQRFVYLVDGVGGGSSVLPVNDSVWLNTSPASVADNFGNIQDNPANKRVPLFLVLPPFEPEIRYGPNPFSPRNAGGAEKRFRLTIRPKTSLALEVTIKASLVIYDKVGNKIKTLSEMKAPNEIEKVWDGSNENGRIVGDGTYLGVLRYAFIVNGKEDLQPPERIKIGVR